MSKEVRIGLVAEGITDWDVIHAIVEQLLAERPFILTLLQPDESVAFTGAGAVGHLGGGWEGVYHWSFSIVDRAGKLSDDAAIDLAFDVFIMHLDADVAEYDPNKKPKPETAALIGTLPCVEPCPPPSATTNRLRQILLAWVGEATVPAKTVLCTPSKATEAWVVPICCPNDKEAQKGTWECKRDPANRLGQQPKHERFRKRHEDYLPRRAQISAGWPGLVARLTEAKRFNDELATALAAVPP